MRVGRDESELRGELLGRTSCVSTDVWMTLVSLCGLYCAFYSFPLLLVTQQHFYPCEQRRMNQAQNWVRV